MTMSREIEAHTPVWARLLRTGRAPVVAVVLLGAGGAIALPTAASAAQVSEKVWLQHACPAVDTFSTYVSKTLDTRLESAGKAKTVSASKSDIVGAIKGFNIQLGKTASALHSIGTPTSSDGRKFASATEAALADLESSMSSAITKIQAIKASKVSSFASSASKDFIAAEDAAQKKVGKSTTNAATPSLRAVAKTVPSCTAAGLG
jgi:hypothetical protein